MSWNKLGWYAAVSSAALAGCSTGGLSGGSGDASPGTSDAPQRADGGRALDGASDGSGSADGSGSQHDSAGTACSAAYSLAVLADSPLAYYAMDESSGGTMVDATSNHLDGSYGGGVALGQSGLVPTEAETSPHFPGAVYAASNIAVVAPTAQLRSSTAFTAEMVFEEDAANAGTVGDGFIDVVSYAWGLQLTPTNTLKLWLPTSNQNIEVVGTTPIVAGQPHEVAATYDGATASLYLDGQLESSAVGTGALSYAGPGGAAGLSMGASPAQPTRAVLQGKIAQVSIYGAALSPSRVQAHHLASGLGGAASCAPSTTADAGSGDAGDAGGPSTQAIQSLLPLTWLTAIGGPQPLNFASPAWRQNASKFSIVEYTDWSGIEGSMSGQTMASSMADVKARAAARGSKYSITGIYQIPQEVSAAETPNTGWDAVCAANHWYLVSGPGPWPSGPLVLDGAYNTKEGLIVANPNGAPVTPLSTVSGWSNGLDWCEAASTYEFNYMINGTPQNVGQAPGSHAANPQCDFVINDNQMWNTYWGGEWLCTSTVYPQGAFGTDTVVFPYLQAGYARKINKWRALSPNAGSGKPMLFGGNCGWLFQSWPFNGVTEAEGYTAPVHQLYDMPFAENVFGNNNPDIQYFSMNAMLAKMANYESYLKSTNPNAVCTFNNEGGPAPGVNWPDPQNATSWSATFSATPVGTNNGQQATNSAGVAIQSGTFWQAARMMVAFALLRGWAIELSGNSTNYEANDPWMDEYQEGALNVLNWLGPPIDPPLTTTNLAQGPQGMYVRRFTNGTVYLNPLGNGRQTVTATGHNLATAGYGDPAINNGAAFTSFVMQDADGRVTLP